MLRALVGLAATCLLVSFNVNAQVASCSSAASDSDGDGWGWENGASCVVTSPEVPGSSSGFCTSASSDSDGDGWGWENGASCQVSSGSSNQNPTAQNPTAQNPTTQNPTTQSPAVAQDNLIAEFTGTLAGTETGTHSFTIADASSISITGLDSFNFDLALFETSGNLIWQDTFWFADQCLPAGNYTVQISQYFPNSLTPQNYTVGIHDQNARCIAPSSTINLGGAGNFAIVTSNGTVLTSSYAANQGVTAYDRFGSRLWSISEASYLDAAESHTDGSTILAYTNNDGLSRIAVVENNGNIRWTLQDTNLYSYWISANDNTVVVGSDGGFTSIDLASGTVNFKHENQNGYAASEARILDDGTIISTVVDQNGSLQLLTFD